MLYEIIVNTIHEDGSRTPYLTGKSAVPPCEGFCLLAKSPDATLIYRIHSLTRKDIAKLISHDAVLTDAASEVVADMINDSLADLPDEEEDEPNAAQ